MGRKGKDEEKIRLKQIKIDKKKSWRENTYGKKNKVDEWKTQNRKKLEYRYFKMLKKEGIDKQNANLTPIGAEKNNFKKVKEDFKKRKLIAEKKVREDEKKMRFLEKQKAKEAYQKKKAEKFKILSQRTRKGQPLMKGRLQLLYEKIKENSSN
ncbi:uncharacterized protein [Lepeophtheirus salmonis]|uniref:Thyroid transcription factor 1-associated protein 26 n=1 Tax=Lepeophtheirus salmonis TaxID=72036 RepID=A0A0K2TXE9_LEPSM|nr:thyroid transcription factor 1-associated protein 26-like [Lepeophtheirus salmonis]